MVDSLFLIAVKVDHISSDDDEERHDESTPEGGHHYDHSPDGGERNEVPETNRAYCDNDNPHRLK